ncbi:hypothetical protein [Afifella pfennigii]|uniref:hypothetical protein n=1 Tax=Afifella pfennigii TaxID=209897 RepID=UPI0012EBF701|nr:hypothetical protein [Afifella pfennigii]
MPMNLLGPLAHTWKARESSFQESAITTSTALAIAIEASRTRHRLAARRHGLAMSPAVPRSTLLLFAVSRLRPAPERALPRVAGGL